MRDWGGEIKPLRTLLKTFIKAFPFSRWRLKFRHERLGIENLKSFNDILSKLENYSYMPNGEIRLSAPGVPYSPIFQGKSNATLLLFDHPEDLKQWYSLATSRLITPHPESPDTWFVNPMFLKISDPMKDVQNEILPLFPKSKVLMAANIVDQIDINIAVSGYLKLKPHVDTLIIAPRVITNKTRNSLIANAVNRMDYSYYSKLTENESPEVLIIDTYGDLAKLYHGCQITYLGGGFDKRKRGFDPMESLFANVPVVLGPIYDFNRVAVDSLRNTRLINVLKSQNTAIKDFVTIGKKILETPPDFYHINELINKRKNDSLNIMTAILEKLVSQTCE